MPEHVAEYPDFGGLSTGAMIRAEAEYGMARRLRVSYSGAHYHLINRGNYRRDVFAMDGAARAFLATVDETCRPLVGESTHMW